MRLTFVGDIALGDHPKAVGFGFRSRYPGSIPPHLATRLAPPGAQGGFLFGNLEFTLGFPPGTTDLAVLDCWGHDAYVPFLVAAGVKAVSVATNHAAQHGHAAFASTVRQLRDAGIHVVGTPGDFTDAGILTIDGRRVAFLGWSARQRQYSSEVPPYNEFGDDAYARVAEARRRADHVVVSMHWGDEFILLPSDEERAIARRLVEAGAAVVVGHHAHVLKPVERIGTAVVAYSLGNFVCDMEWDIRTRLSGWLEVDLAADGVRAASLTPAIVAEDYFPRPAAGPDLAEHVALEREREAQAGRIAASGYAAVVEAERKRHALRTAWQMVRKIHRYPRGMAGHVFRNAIGHRLRSLFGR